MKQRTPEESRNRINRLSEALFGAPSEIDEDEADELLSESGINTEALKKNIYNRLCTEAQKHRSANRNLPPLLKKALDDLRPITLPARNEAEIARQAKAGVELVMEKAKLLVSALVPAVPIRFAGAYRNKKGLTEKDRTSLNNVQEELRKKIERLKGKDDKSR